MCRFRFLLFFSCFFLLLLLLIKITGWMSLSKEWVNLNPFIYQHFPWVRICTRARNVHKWVTVPKKTIKMLLMLLYKGRLLTAAMRFKIQWVKKNVLEYLFNSRFRKSFRSLSWKPHCNLYFSVHRKELNQDLSLGLICISFWWLKEVIQTYEFVLLKDLYPTI